MLWDADSIPLRPFRFFESTKDSKVILFETSTEYHIAYFDTINTLNIPIANNKILYKMTQASFITENMMIDSKVMCELLDLIESTHNSAFHKAIMSCIKASELGASGFSEYECYGNFFLAKYPQNCRLITRKRQRYAKRLIGSRPSASQLKWLAKYYDVISIEHFDCEGALSRLTRFRFFRIFSPKALKKLCRFAKKLHIIKDECF